MGLNSTYTLEQLEHEYQAMKEAKETALRQSAWTTVVGKIRNNNDRTRGVPLKMLESAFKEECRKRGVGPGQVKTISAMIRTLAPDDWVTVYSCSYLRGRSFNGQDVEINQKKKEKNRGPGKLRAVAVSIECYEDVAAIAKERNECIATIVREALSVYLAIHKAKGNNGNN